jgi:hypothetical protein
MRLSPKDGFALKPWKESSASAPQEVAYKIKFLLLK